MLRTLLFFIFLPVISFAAELEIVGPCSERAVYSFEVGDKFDTVADLTFYLLDKNRIPYTGTNKGITTLINAPSGDAALEVLSDTKMRAYGWCFFVNGKMSLDYADEVYLNPGDKVQWIYSYAWFDREWKSMCNPSFKVKSPQICQKR